MIPQFRPLTRAVFETLQPDDLVFYRSPGRMVYTDLYQICLRDGRLFYICDGYDAPRTEVGEDEFLKWIEPLTFKMVRFRLYRGFGMAIYVRQCRLGLESMKKHLLGRLTPEYLFFSYKGDSDTYNELVRAVTQELERSAGCCKA